MRSYNLLFLFFAQATLFNVMINSLNFYALFFLAGGEMVSFRLLSAQDKALICILGIRFFKAVNQIISVISRGWGGVVRLRSLLPQHG